MFGIQAHSPMWETMTIQDRDRNNFLSFRKRKSSGYEWETRRQRCTVRLHLCWPAGTRKDNYTRGRWQACQCDGSLWIPFVLRAFYSPRVTPDWTSAGEWGARPAQIFPRRCMRACSWNAHGHVLPDDKVHMCLCACHPWEYIEQLVLKCKRESEQRSEITRKKKQRKQRRWKQRASWRKMGEKQ